MTRLTLSQVSRSANYTSGAKLNRATVILPISYAILRYSITLLRAIKYIKPYPTAATDTNVNAVSKTAMILIFAYCIMFLIP